MPIDPLRRSAAVGSSRCGQFVTLTGNYAGTAALLAAFDMQLDPDQPLPLLQL
jgi:hypothetical protein